MRLLRSAVRALAGLLPVSVGICGARRDSVLRLFDSWALPHSGTEVISVGEGSLELDFENVNERLLCLVFHNVLRGARLTPLYTFMTKLSTDFDKRPERLFLDIGANLGMYSLLARRLGYTTLLFEPEPSHAAFLERNREVMGSVANIAIGAVTGMRKFYITGDDDPGGSSFVLSDNDGDAHYCRSEEVMVSRLDDYLAENSVDAASIALIKVDVEGFEFDAVRGFDGVFEQGVRPPVWCEVRGPESDRTPDSYILVCEHLKRFGYSPYLADRGLPEPFNPADASVPQVFDLLFLAEAA